MVINKKVRGKAGSIAKGLTLGTLAALCITVLFAIAMTQMVLAEKLSAEAVGYGVLIVLPIATAISALIAVGIIKRRRMQICLMAGLAYFVVLGVVNVVFFGGQFGGAGVALLMIALGALGVGAMGLRGEKGHKKRYEYSRPR